MGKGKDPKVLLAEREPVVIIVEEDVTHKALLRKWRLHLRAKFFILEDMQRVFVLDKSRQPLMPCTASRARKLLSQGKATILKLHPFRWIKAEIESYPLDTNVSSNA
jgi:hypothetical protein